jgi:hypothetical protein
MWVKRQVFIDLIARAASLSSTAEWLRIRVNQLERENAVLKNQKFHLPVDVPEIERVEPPEPLPGRVGVRDAGPQPPSVQDLLVGNINMEDMGDEEARRQGIE